MEPLLLLFTIVFVIPASAGETLRVHFGDSFELKESGSQGCIWTVPNQESDNDQGNDVTINIFDPENESKDNQTLGARPNSWKWQYVGNSKTSCNIKIWGAITDDTGTWTFESGNSATKTHQVTIIVPPEEPFADNDNNYLFELDNDNMEVWRNLVFYAKNCNPIPEVKMSLDGNLLGNNIVTTDTLQFNDTDPNKPRAPTVLTAKTTLNITIKPEDDGKTLSYVAEHPAKGNKSEQSLAVNLTVLAPPSTTDSTISGLENASVGSLVKLQLRFHSNPQPESVKWFMHDLGGDYLNVENVGTPGTLSRTLNTNGTQIYANNTRYQMGNFSKDGEKWYITEVILPELQRSDIDQMNYVVVTNSRGNGTYQVAFTVDEDANEKLSEAAIAGIVIGVVLAVLVIFAVAFFLFKKKKGKKSKRINPVPEPRSNVPDQEGGRDNPAQENE